jgi:hypothetical protein
MKLVTEQDLVSAVPVPISSEPKVPMNRNHRLMRWAGLIRASRVNLMLFHDLEYMSPKELGRIDLVDRAPSAFSIAVNDPVFQAQGLGAGANIPEIMEFMEIDQQELHEFSCDCGGVINNEMMANRIERIGGRWTTIAG